MSTQAFSSGPLGWPAIYPSTSQKITTSGTSQQSAAVASTTSIIRIVCDQDCYIAIGANPTASSSTCFVQKGYCEYFSIGAGEKIAVIQASTTGTFYMTEGK